MNLSNDFIIVMEKTKYKDKINSFLRKKGFSELEEYYFTKYGDDSVIWKTGNNFSYGDIKHLKDYSYKYTGYEIYYAKHLINNKTRDLKELLLQS